MPDVTERLGSLLSWFLCQTEHFVFSGQPEIQPFLFSHRKEKPGIISFQVKPNSSFSTIFFFTFYLNGIKLISKQNIAGWKENGEIFHSNPAEGKEHFDSLIFLTLLNFDSLNFSLFPAKRISSPPRRLANYL